MSRARAAGVDGTDRGAKKPPRARPVPRGRTARKRTATVAPGPRGRDQIIDAVIEATIELCRMGGPTK